MSIQRFAWLPKIVWDMKAKDYEYKVIWLCWYWDDGENNSEDSYYRLTDEDEPPMTDKRYIRTITNTW